MTITNRSLDSNSIRTADSFKGPFQNEQIAQQKEDKITEVSTSTFFPEEQNYLIKSLTLEKQDTIFIFEKGKEKISQFLLIAKTELLGKGGEGRVFRQKNDPNRAIKKSDCDLEEEFEIGHMINHPNITKSHHLYKKKYINGTYKSYLVMDKVNGESIKSLEKHQRKFPNEVVRNLINQARDCCLYLFKNNISWNDIHNENIFIENNNLKLIDFGDWKRVENVDCLPQDLIFNAEALLINLMLISSLGRTVYLHDSFDDLYEQAGLGIKMERQEIINTINNSFDEFLEKFDSCIRDKPK